MRFLVVCALTGLAVLQSSFIVRAQEKGEQPDLNVRFDLATTTRLGIVTAPVAAVQYRAETQGIGVIIPFDSLVQADADLATAEAAVEASKAAVDRARSLFNANVSISRQTVEAAERQATADFAQLVLAQRKASIAWGQAPPWRTAAERNALLARLTVGDIALARVTLLTSAIGSGTPSSLKVERVDAGQNAMSWTATSIWNAPADPNVPGRSFFALIERAHGLLPGERLVVSVPTGHAQQGVIIPAAAVLIADGMGWYYDRETAMPVIPLAPFYIFNRRMLDLSQPTPGGYFVPNGDPKQVVVVDGAGLILARETGATDEDED